MAGKNLWPVPRPGKATIATLFSLLCFIGLCSPAANAGRDRVYLANDISKIIFEYGVTLNNAQKQAILRSGVTNFTDSAVGTQSNGSRRRFFRDLRELLVAQPYVPSRAGYFDGYADNLAARLLSAEKLLFAGYAGPPAVLREQIKDLRAYFQAELEKYRSVEDNADTIEIHGDDLCIELEKLAQNTFSPALKKHLTTNELDAVKASFDLTIRKFAAYRSKLSDEVRLGSQGSYYSQLVSIFIEIIVRNTIRPDAARLNDSYPSKKARMVPVHESGGDEDTLNPTESFVRSQMAYSISFLEQAYHLIWALSDVSQCISSRYPAFVISFNFEAGNHRTPVEALSCRLRFHSYENNRRTMTVLFDVQKVTAEGFRIIEIGQVPTANRFNYFAGKTGLSLSFDRGTYQLVSYISKEIYNGRTDEVRPKPFSGMGSTIDPYWFGYLLKDLYRNDAGEDMTKPGAEGQVRLHTESSQHRPFIAPGISSIVRILRTPSVQGLAAYSYFDAQDKLLGNTEFEAPARSHFQTLTSMDECVFPANGNAIVKNRNGIEQNVEVATRVKVFSGGRIIVGECRQVDRFGCLPWKKTILNRSGDIMFVVEYSDWRRSSPAVVKSDLLRSDREIEAEFAERHHLNAVSSDLFELARSGGKGSLPRMISAFLKNNQGSNHVFGDYHAAVYAGLFADLYLQNGSLAEAAQLYGAMADYLERNFSADELFYLAKESFSKKEYLRAEILCDHLWKKNLRVVDVSPSDVDLLRARSYYRVARSDKSQNVCEASKYYKQFVKKWPQEAGSILSSLKDSK